jgi:adenylate kinase family enzyme
MHHAAIASFGAANVFVFDLLRGHVGGHISGLVARDAEFWEKKILPISIGMMGACIGVLPMHAACASIEGKGLLIAGASGAGKSTLSAAMSQAGFDYLSDDWTYIHIANGRLSAHGTSAPVKLLPDAARHFSGLANEEIVESMNGELAYEVDPVKAFGASVVHQCEPKWVVFLERFHGDGSEFVRLKEESSRIYLESSVERLPGQLKEATVRRVKIIDHISELQCWRFRYGGRPQYAVHRLREFVESRMREDA